MPDAYIIVSQAVDELERAYVQAQTNRAASIKLPPVSWAKVHAREEQREHDFSECDARAEMGSLSLRLIGSLSSCSPVSRHLISAEIHRLMLRLMISETSRDGQDRFAEVRPSLLAVESPPRGTREARPLGVLHTRFAVQTRASR